MNLTFKNIVSRSLVFLFFTVVLMGCSSPEEKAADYVESGHQLFEKDDYVKSSLQFRNALQINSNNVEALYGLALIEEKNQVWRKLFDLLTNIRAIDPSHIEAQIKLAQLYLASGQIDKALEDAKDLMQRLPDDARTHALMAAVLFRLDNIEGAKLAVGKAFAIDSGNKEAILVLARIHVTEKQFLDAHQVLDKGIAENSDNTSMYLFKIQAYIETRDQRGIESTFKLMIDAFPNNLSYRRSLAQYYSGNDEMEEAEQVYQGIVEKDPDNVEEKLRYVSFTTRFRSPDAGEALLNSYIEEQGDEYRYQLALGELLSLQSKFKQAENVYQKVIDAVGLQPKGLVARNRIALIAVRENNRDKATDLIQQVLEKDKNDENSLLIQAGYKLQDGEFDDAIIDLRTVLRDSPDSVRALSLLADAYRAKGSRELALDNYLKAFRLSPSSEKLSNQLAEYYLGAKNISRAEEVLEESVSKGNRRVTTLQLLTQVKLSLQKWDEAEAHAKRLQLVQGQEALSQQMLGLVFQGRKQQSESIDAFKKAHELSPASSQPIVSLVRTYVGNGQMDNAKSFLKSVLSVHAENITAYTLLGQLSVFEKHPEQAESYFIKSLEIDPKHVSGYQYLASIYRSNQKIEKAENIINQGLGILPDSLMLNMILANLYESQQQYSRAIGIYESLLAKRPDYVVAKNNLASLLTDHNPDKASLERARSISSDFKDSKIPYFRDTYAWVQVMSDKRLKEAVEILEGVVKEVGQQPVFRYHLGKGYEKIGDHENARKQLKLAMETGGEEAAFYEDAMKALESIN